MSTLPDPMQNFKLHLASNYHGFTKRNMAIWSMILNRLGLPDTFEESVRAIYTSGNWDETEWDEITIMRMARSLTSNLKDQERLYNRLKKNIPKFFEWQSEQSFKIIDRQIINERAQKYKTKARFNFLLYDIVVALFDLPQNLSQKAVRMTVEETLKSYPKVDRPPRRSRKRSSRSVIKSISTNINELIEIDGSKVLAACEASNNEVIVEFSKLVTEITDSQGE